MEKQKIFGIFEGGGIRAIAHGGAYEAVSRGSRFEFVGIAGTSAGSIVAALIAAGASSEFVKHLLLFTDFRELLDPECRDVNITSPQALLEELLNEGMLGRAITITSALYSGGCLMTRLLSENGIHSGTPVIDWFRGALKECCGNADLRFRDIAGKNLKIIATNLTIRSLTVFSSELTPDVKLWEAVRASTSIPFFFKPFKLDGGLFVDGALLSNFPAWVFDYERKEFQSATTVGFRLREPTPQPREPATFFDFVTSFCETAINGDDLVQCRGIPSLIPVNLPTEGLDWLSLDIVEQVKAQLYDEAARVTDATLATAFRLRAESPNTDALHREVAEGMLPSFKANGHSRRQFRLGWPAWLKGSHSSSGQTSLTAP